MGSDYHNIQKTVSSAGYLAGVIRAMKRRSVRWAGSVERIGFMRSACKNFSEILKENQNLIHLNRMIILK
jgi:hypothetical protein